MEKGARQGKFFKYDKQLVGIESAKEINPSRGLTAPRGKLISFADSIPTRCLSFTYPSVLSEFCSLLCVRSRPIDYCHIFNNSIVPCPFQNVLLDNCSPMTSCLNNNPLSSLTSYEYYKAQFRGEPS